MYRKPLMANFLRLFLPGVALVLAGVFFYGRADIERDEVRLMSGEALRVGLGAGTLSRQLEGITRDLNFLANHSALLAAVNAPTPANIAHLAEDLVNFSRSSGIYDQLRWIDETGMEQVRIDNAGGQGIKVAADKLQNKGQRYFFTDAIKLRPGEIFVSPLDLNIEQNQIEVPHKPMLRVATPVADTQGRKRGIVILNFYGQVMLDAFAASTQDDTDHAMVLNAEGYRLKSSVSANDWAFMFKRPDLSLAAQAPLAWNHITAADNGQKWLADGLWSWYTVYPLLAGQRSSNGAADAAMPSSAALGKTQYFWKAVTHLPSGSLRAMRQAVWGRLAWVGLLLLGLLAAASYKLAHARTLQEATDAEIRIAATAFESQEGMIITDAQAVILRVNLAFCGITGYNAAEVVGRNPSLLQSGLQSADFYADMWQHIHASGNWMGEIWNKRKNGDIYPEQLNITAVKNAAGQVTNYVATLVDIAEHKLREENLRQATELAQAANVAKSRFLATMSHEIRTPMNGILGLAQLLLMPNLQEDRRNDHARTILSSGQSLLSLLNDILDLSRVEAGKLQLESTAFAPEALLHETCNLFAGAARVKGLQVEDQWQGVAGQHYLADAHRLRQMLGNLVGNALKFTRTGFVRLQAIEIECSETSALLEFSVSDSGMGIAADKLDLLFKPFSQTDNSIMREFGGSGLGLSIVVSLAKAMGGEVGVSSTPGVGSRFWFRVPAQRVTVTPDTCQTPREAPLASLTPTDAQWRGHVLVAEDNLVNCMVIESLLAQLGLQVTVVHDGQKAVAAVQTGAAFDLVLMDLQMPVQDGYQATVQIRQSEAAQQRPHLPIIALTANAFEEDRQRCLAIGMDDFLTKPIALAALKTALSRWLSVNVPGG